MTGPGKRGGEGIRVVACALALTLAMLFCTPSAPSAAPAKTALTARDKAFLAAHDAYAAGDRGKLARQAPLVKGHELQSYVRYWELRLGLTESNPAEVASFLEANEGTVIAEQLRRDWLRMLGKNVNWEIFRQQRPALIRDDAEVACYALQMRRAEAPGSVSAAELSPYWNASRPLPNGCAAVADEMILSGELTDRDLRERFRQLVYANQLTEARRIMARMPAGQAPAAAQFDDAVRDPAAFLAKGGADLASPSGREAVIAAMLRQAKNDPAVAANYWKGLPADAFPEVDRQAVWALVAVQGALSHLPESLEWFRLAADAPLADEQRAWQARIALRLESWPEVKQAIERMSPEAREESAWIYWLGRSLLALGATDQGKAMLVRIAGEHHFYGLLAAEELGLPLSLPPQAAPTQKELDAAAAAPGFKRALLLQKFGLHNEAVQEWMWTLRGMDDRSLLAGAELARHNGIWDMAINTAEKTVALHDFALRYLAPYSEVLGRQADLRQIEQPLILGLVRQESRFNAEAVSSAGARGLMQLMPATAKWAANKLGMKNFSPTRATQPEVNATLGAFYLKHVLDGFDGSPVLATAAYNAGPLRARRWMNGKPLAGAIYVESIPFSETRQYVKKVLTNEVYYAAVLTGESRSLKAILGTVAGVGSLKNLITE